VKIVSIAIQNFLSFGDAVIGLGGAGLTLVEGENRDDKSAHSNGSGKSAIFDALVWCLFGTTLRGYENDEVIHRKVGSDCLVSVSLETDDGDMYMVMRARRHREFKNSLRVKYVNFDEDMSAGSNADTQLVVEKLLGCTLRTFLSSVVFGQDRAYRFSSLTDKEQKEILDEVLGVERFAEACTIARARVASLNTSIATISKSLDRARELMEEDETEVDDLREKDKGFETDRTARVLDEHEKMRKLKDQIKKTDRTLNPQMHTTHAALTKEVSVLDAEVSNARDVVAKSHASLTHADDVVSSIQRKLKQHETRGGVCGACKRPLDDAVDHANMIASVKKELKAAEKVAAAAKLLAEAHDTALTGAKHKLQKKRVELEALGKSVIAAAQAEANVKEWTQRLTIHEERAAEIEAETNAYAALIKKVELRYAKHSAEVDLFDAQLAAEEAQLKLVDFWVKAFGARGLRSLLLDSSMPLLNAEAARVSRAITGGAIKVRFSVTSDLKSGKTVDRFEVQVDNKHGAGTYAGCSAGERAKVDLCVGLALQSLVASRSSATFNVVAFDEAFDHLDSAAHERVIDVLSEIDKESVFVISHDEDLKAWFPASLRVVKKNGFSTVET
jgi:DNA repair exonuclease SbcCD ATPase subunit